MPLRTEAQRAALLLLASLALAHPAAQAQDAPEAQAVTVEQVDAALQQLQADPNLAIERKVRAPRWRSTPNEGARSDGLKWIIELFGWIAQVSRVLVWVVIILLIGALALYLTRIVRRRRAANVAPTAAPPTHVRELDIRPESLPDDIGAAAWRLWQGGEQRAALALLYRGLLSRLVHTWRTPIRESSTEGDCLSLASAHLSAERMQFVTRLISCWQRTVYGGQPPQESSVRALCDEFAAALAPSDSSRVEAGA